MTTNITKTLFFIRKSIIFLDYYTLPCNMFLVMRKISLDLDKDPWLSCILITGHCDRSFVIVRGGFTMLKSLGEVSASLPVLFPSLFPALRPLLSSFRRHAGEAARNN